MESLRKYLPTGGKNREKQIEKAVSPQPSKPPKDVPVKAVDKPNPNTGIELTPEEKAEVKKYKSGGLVSRQKCKHMGKAC